MFCFVGGKACGSLDPRSGMLDLSSLTRDQACNPESMYPCIGSRVLNTGLPRKSWEDTLKTNFYWEFLGDSVVIGPRNFSSRAQVRWLVGELGSKNSYSRSKVETRLHGEGMRWGREIWKNSGRLLRGRSKAGKRRNPRQAKVFQIITFPRI